MDVNEEFKFLRKWKKIEGGRVGGGSQVGGGGGRFRVDVNTMLGVGGDVGYEPRIEGIVQCTKRYCTVLRKFKKNVGGGRGNI